MTIAHSIIYGIVQGLTEFFPVSSSGHLVILQRIFGFKESQLAFDVFIHVGTLFAVAIYLRKDIISIIRGDRKTIYLVAIGSIPTFIIGFLFKDIAERLFSGSRLVGYALITTGVLLIVAYIYLRKPGTKRSVSPLSSVIMGVAQGVAVIPGISRSGSTLVSGILAGVEREAAFRFSFLLSMPAIAGATALKALELKDALLGPQSPCFIAGALAAMVTGIFALAALLKAVRKNLLHIFGIYCVIAGFIVIIFL